MKTVNKKGLALVTILLLISITAIPIIDSKTINIKNKGVFFQDKYETSFVYIDASSPYDYGWKAGRLLRSQYKLLDIFARFTKINNIKKQDIEDQINYMAQYSPFFLEELKGLSSSTNIKLERLLTLKNFLRYGLGGHCSTTLSTGPATKNNETFLTDNRDMSISGIKGFIGLFVIRLISRNLWVKENKHYPLHYKYVCWGIPILNEWPLINEKGLGFGGTGTLATKNESRYIDRGPGISDAILWDLTMTTCKNVSEVAELYQSVERASDVYNNGKQINDVIAWCDSEGGILMIEESHNHILPVFGNSTEITGSPPGILWHANHHQWIDPNLTGSIFPYESTNSNQREKRLHELLEKNYGQITLDVCKSITRDHGGGLDPNGKDSHDICHHPDKYKFAITQLSYIILPKEMKIYFAHGSPCRSRFRCYDVSKIFEK